MRGFRSRCIFEHNRSLIIEQPSVPIFSPITESIIVSPMKFEMITSGGIAMAAKTDPKPSKNKMEPKVELDKDNDTPPIIRPVIIMSFFTENLLLESEIRR